MSTPQISETESRVQESVVLIKKCRYLEASGCVGLCVNLCKVRRTQDMWGLWGARRASHGYAYQNCGIPL